MFPVGVFLGVSLGCENQDLAYDLPKERPTEHHPNVPPKRPTETPKETPKEHHPEEPLEPPAETTMATSKTAYQAT